MSLVTIQINQPTDAFTSPAVLRCCGPATAACCSQPHPLDSTKKVGAVRKQFFQCDECGSELNLSQVHAAHGLHR